MIIYHVNPIWLEQTQTWIYGQVAELQRMGADTHVVCERTKNLDQFRVNAIHCLSAENRIIRAWDKGLRKLRIRRHLDFLVKSCMQGHADIVHSHFGNIGWNNLGAVRRLGARHVVTYYGIDVNRLPVQYPVWRKRYRQLFSEVDAILCEGTHMAHCIIAMGCPQEKVKVQHLGIDVDRIEFRPRKWLAGEPLRVLIAASFREKKGIPYAIEALGRINESVPVELTVIGDAGRDEEGRKERVRILEALSRSGLQDRVRMLGYQPHSVLLREAYAHHVFVQASVTASNGDTEGGAPVSIIEMLASGMPVVSTLHCDIPEVMGPDLRRLLAPERDPKALADILGALSKEPNGWADLVRIGRDRIESEYNLKTQARRLMDVYANCLGSVKGS